MSSGTDKTRRSWVTGICWFLAGFFAFWALLRIAGLEGGFFPVVQLVAYTPYLLLLSGLALVVVSLLRRWPAAGVLLAAVIALTAVVLPRELGGPEEMPGGKPVRVLGANLAKGNADSEALLEMAVRKDADIVFLQEVSLAKARELRGSGFDSAFPHQVFDVTENKGGGAILARWPLSQLESLPVGRQPRATVAIPGSTPIEVVSVHPTAPIKPGTTRAWDDDYESMPAAQSGERPLVLVGDFNATLDHENLRDLIDTGYRDAGEVTGEGFVPTWPARPKLTLRRLSLPVTIDHVLAEKGIAISDYDVEEIIGSDHRAVFAELLIPPAAEAG